MPYMVADSALYTEENLQRLSEVKWLTQVPERVGLARQLHRSGERRGDATRPPGRVSLFGGVHHLGRDTPALAGGLVGTGGTTGAGDPAEAGGKGEGESGESLAGAVPSGIFLAGGSGSGRAGAGAEVALSPVGGALPAGEALRPPGASSGGYGFPSGWASACKGRW